MAKAKANILMILLDHTFPPDIRVEKEVLALKKNYNIFLLANRKVSEKYFEVREGIFILRMDRPFSKIRVLSYLTDRLASLLKIVLIVSEYKIKILHVHDLPYALPVAILGKVLRKKVIFDMHENYADTYAYALATGRFSEEVGARSRLGKLWVLYIRLLEILASNLVAKVVVVIEENAERLVDLGIPRNKIVVVSNTVNLERLEKAEEKKRSKSLENKFIISYVGGFGYHRGIETLIKALSIVVKKVSKVHLIIVGDRSTEQRKMFENMCKQLSIEEYVTFTGWVTFNEAMDYMQISDLTVIPHLNTPQTNTTIPHKIFQSMYLKKPVVVSDVKPMKRIVEETKCGITFQAGNHEQLANSVLKLMKNPGLMREMGEKGQKAVLNKYNWNVDGERLLQLYVQLENE